MSKGTEHASMVVALVTQVLSEQAVIQAHRS